MDRGPAKRRILFIEQFYYPDGWGGAELPLDLTVHLARAGFDVEVICGADQYAPVQGNPPPDPRQAGVRIRRIPALLRGNIHRAKLLRQLWFYLALLPLLLFRRPPDLLVAQTNPPLAVILAAAAARLRRKPMIIIAMDLYPEVLIAHGMRAHGAAAAMLTRGFKWAYRSARRVVALGPVMARRLAAKGVDTARIVEIPNWATGTLGVVSGAANALRSEWHLEDKFVVLYSGNLGLAHEFDTLLRGVEQARRSVPSLRMVFIGRGSRLAEATQRVAELGLESIVRFSDLVEPGRLPESFGLAQLAAVTLRPGFEGLVVPSKLQGYMARGIPILYIGPDSDIDRFIQRSAAGLSLACGDSAAVASTLIELAGNPRRLADLGAAGRRYYAVNFSKSHGLSRYESVIRAALEPDAAAP